MVAALLLSQQRLQGIQARAFAGITVPCSNTRRASPVSTARRQFDL
jgi:hypothetical protein